jgi:hypothetical protein
MVQVQQVSALFAGGQLSPGNNSQNLESWNGTAWTETTDMNQKKKTWWILIR